MIRARPTTRDKNHELTFRTRERAAFYRVDFLFEIDVVFRFFFSRSGSRVFAPSRNRSVRNTANAFSPTDFRLGRSQNEHVVRDSSSAPRTENFEISEFVASRETFDSKTRDFGAARV